MNANSQPDPVPYAGQLESLPLFAQALVACRMARRAVQAMLNGADEKCALLGCDAIESVIELGVGWCDDNPVLSSLARISSTRDNEAALVALNCAIGSVGAAQSAIDFPVSTNVSPFVQRCIEAVVTDPRISKVQVVIILKSDIDQITFACKEAKIDTCDGVSDYVLGRLTPCHALSLVEPPRCIEEEYR